MSIPGTNTQYRGSDLAYTEPERLVVLNALDDIRHPSMVRSIPSKPPKVMFPESSNHFDRDLDVILDRIYRSDPSTRTDIASNSVTPRKVLMRREQGSTELKQALAELRGMREKSQSMQRLKEEVDYLQDQIDQMKTLGERIVALRKQLSEDGG
ncbi:hypothetical protein [Thiocystis violascens]|nr:hypothetical protein [Thiocystis violascens]